ncbi:MAG TPA: metal ABC transporter permease [Verrucomicrobiota bacterium]|nr:metal ABC transporter permease [Verrucomicrobiota bacterium]
MKRALFILVLLCLATCTAMAARIGDVSDINVREQAVRFFTLQDPGVRYALAGSLLLGLTCGLLGSFIVVRKMALMGDTLSHAVLPGVAVGFLWTLSKDPLRIFIGATCAALMGAALVGFLKRSTRLKEDTALGMVLATFFAVGVCLLTMIQQMPTADKGGLDKFLFGQAAAISAADLRLMGAITAIAIAAVVIFYKELLVTSFDADFAQLSGLPARVFHYGLILLVASAVVIALQAVGVVLVSAMLITPAAAAYLLTDRLHRMLILAAIFGMLAGAAGAFLSFLGPALPTGPLIVLGATAIFVAAFLFGPRQGLVVRWAKQRSRVRRVQRENTLKAIYHVLEKRNFHGEGVSLRELAERRRETVEEARTQTRALHRHGLVTLHEDGNMVFLTPAGWQLACSIVRIHRLWGLYLTNAADIAADHVHDDAENIEHVLGEEVVREIERRLQYAERDPHGRPIPSLADVERGAAPRYRPDESVGYGSSI